MSESLQHGWWEQRQKGKKTWQGLRPGEAGVLKEGRRRRRIVRPELSACRRREIQKGVEPFRSRPWNPGKKSLAGDVVRVGGPIGEPAAVVAQRVVAGIRYLGRMSYPIVHLAQMWNCNKMGID